MVTGWLSPRFQIEYLVFKDPGGLALASEARPAGRGLRRLAGDTGFAECRPHGGKCGIGHDVVSFV